MLIKLDFGKDSEIVVDSFGGNFAKSCKIGKVEKLIFLAMNFKISIGVKINVA